MKLFLILLLKFSDRISNKLFGKTFLRPWRFANGTEASHLCNSIFGQDQEFKYLEIGVSRGNTFEAVRANYKIAVDPQPRYFAIPRSSVRTIATDSDTFFSNNIGPYFDLIYLDGLHHFRQTWRDIHNATRVISPKGIILIDDVVPVDKFSALTPESHALLTRKLSTGSKSEAWHGDVYKSVLMLSKLPKTFKFMTILFKNPKAILFCSDGNWNSFPQITDQELDHLEPVNVESVFSFSPKPVIPEYFNPVMPDTAIQLIKDFRHLN